MRQLRSTFVSVLVIALSLAGAISLFSFRSNPDANDVVYEFMQFSTIESVVPGGLGRSRILTTDGQGQMIEKELKNFYSFAGINLGNIANNDKAIVDRINEYERDGWDLFDVATGSHATISNGSSSGGIFITRYLFRKAKN
jgi:hypothetical protein